MSSRGSAPEMFGHLNPRCPVSQRPGRGSSLKDKGGTQAQRGASPGQEGGDHQELVQGGGDDQEVTWVCPPSAGGQELTIKMYIKNTDDLQCFI